MAKQIIILSISSGSKSTDQTVTAAFWIPVIAGHQIPVPSFTSLFRGASGSELSALRSGSVVEQIYITQFPTSFTLSQIQSSLISQYSLAVANFGNLPNPNQFYGAFFDGTIWNAATGLVSGIIQGFQFGASLPSTLGDNTIVLGVPNQSIAIQQMLITALGPVTVQIKDGATVIGGFQFGAGGGSYPLHLTGQPWFVTSPGNNFVTNLSAAVQCAITGWFTQA